MKTNRLLRILSLLGFLLLLAPFYDSCDGGMKRAEANSEPMVDSIILETDSINTKELNKSDIDTFKDSALVSETSICKKAYEFIVDEDSSHGYDFVWANINSTPKEIIKEINEVADKKEWYKNLFIYISFIFDLITLISFSLLILSFTKKQKTFNKLALMNCVLIIITFSYIVLLEKSFEHWRQIKWGYYAFIIFNLLIFYYSKTNKSQIVNHKS